MIGRRKTRVVKVGGVKIGGSNPISIQSMTTSDTRDIGKTVSAIKRLEKAGCEIVRVAVKDLEAARAIKRIKRKIRIPLVGDIHFDYRLALESIKSGADKIRINPGNITKPEHLKEIIEAAKRRRIPIRIGLNSGSLPHRSTEGAKAGPHTDVFIKTALKHIKLFESHRFDDIIISLKSSRVPEMVDAYRRLAGLCDYPFHVGVTAAGPYDVGVVKSSIGIGALLLNGIGDTVRVSLTGDPVNEVVSAKYILQATGRREFGPDIISCPTCGRCQVDLAYIVTRVEEKLNAIRNTQSAKRIKSVALMGCEVNGPGEAKEADIGIAFGKDAGVIFMKGKIVKRVRAKNAVRELLHLVSKAI
ncbi:MAG: flavodoxin-dependent (E)-4-hydroxy-3-methylbut-2-enyl-diphosphate synthase [Candidatus Omnitrophota bacterium]